MDVMRCVVLTCVSMLVCTRVLLYDFASNSLGTTAEGSPAKLCGEGGEDDTRTSNSKKLSWILRHGERRGCVGYRRCSEGLVWMYIWPCPFLSESARPNPHLRNIVAAAPRGKAATPPLGYMMMMKMMMMMMLMKMMMKMIMMMMLMMMKMMMMMKMK
jgi:hypothetical protein